MPIFEMLLNVLLLFGRCFDVLQVAHAAKEPSVVWLSLLLGRLLLHSVGLVSCTSSTCVLQMYFLLCLGHVSVALGTDRAGWFCRLQRGTVHLQPPQITAPEATLIHNACLRCPPNAGAVACGLVEIKAPWSTHELKSIHQFSPAKGLWSSRGGAGEGEQAEGQVEEMWRRHDVYLYLQEVTEADLK